MAIIFIGSLFPENRLEEIRANNTKGIDNAANNLQWALIKGLDYFYIKMTVLTLPTINSFPKGYKKIKFKASNFQHKQNSEDYALGFLNLPLIKHLSKTISLRKKLNELLNEINQDTIIFVYSIHSPLLNAVCNLKQKYSKIKVCLIVPDLPQFMSENKNPLYRFFKRIDRIFIDNYLKKIDFFVLLNDSMKKELNVGKRPCIRVEGIYKDVNIYEQYQNKEKNKTIFYSGTLSSRYGILNLLKAFSSIEATNYRLWICGSGNTSDIIKNYVKNDQRILYFGQLPYDEVIKLQKRATVLVNPRTSEGEYTKYSFPSKTMEYLGSGTPTILYRLEGIPEEYYNYCFVAKDENSEGLKKTIIQVCEKSQKELNVFGKLAQEFILKNKNPEAQVKKIFEMVNSMSNF